MFGNKIRKRLAFLMTLMITLSATFSFSNAMGTESELQIEPNVSQADLDVQEESPEVLTESGEAPTNPANVIPDEAEEWLPEQNQSAYTDEVQSDEVQHSENTASDITPLTASGLRVTAAPTDVYGGTVTDIRASWTEMSVKPSLITVTVTNGAKIIASDTNDIIYQSHGNTTVGSVSELNINTAADQMTFVVSAGGMIQASSVAFKVEAPLDNSNFEVTVFAGETNGNTVSTIANTSTATLNVIPSLTIDIKDGDGNDVSTVNDAQAFYLSGTATDKGNDAPDPSYLMLIITNKETGEVVAEYNDVIMISQKKYEYGPVTMPTAYAEGLYSVAIYLMHDDPGEFRILGSAEKEITFSRAAPSPIPPVQSTSPEVAIYNLSTGFRVSEPLDINTNTYASLEYDLWVRPHTYMVSNNSLYGNNNIGASIWLQDISNVSAVKFIVDTTFGAVPFESQQSENMFYADLTTFRTHAITVSGILLWPPTISCEITYKDGSTKSVTIGELNVMEEPSGIFTDLATNSPVSGTLCTLYQRVGSQWLPWTDPEGKQANPVTTDASGQFGWKVPNGNYYVGFYHPNYHTSADQYFSSQLTMDYFNGGTIAEPTIFTIRDIR